MNKTDMPELGELLAKRGDDDKTDRYLDSMARHLKTKTVLYIIDEVYQSPEDGSVGLRMVPCIIAVGKDHFGNKRAFKLPQYITQQHYESAISKGKTDVPKGGWCIADSLAKWEWKVRSDSTSGFSNMSINFLTLNPALLSTDGPWIGLIKNLYDPDGKWKDMNWQDVFWACGIGCKLLEPKFPPDHHIRAIRNDLRDDEEFEKSTMWHTAWSNNMESLLNDPNSVSVIHKAMKEREQYWTEFRQKRKSNIKPAKCDNPETEVELEPPPPAETYEHMEPVLPDEVVRQILQATDLKQVKRALIEQYPHVAVAIICG